MRIGINGQLLREQNSGVEYCISDLVGNLTKVDSENEYIFYTNKGLFGDNGFSNDLFSIKKTGFLNRIRLIRILWEQTFFPYLLFKDGIDVFHAPGYVMPMLCSVPTVVTIPDVITLLFPQMCKRSNHMHYQFLLPTVIKKAKRIITMSHNSKKDIINTLGVSEDKIEVIYNGVHPSFVQIHDILRLEQIRKKYNLPEKIILFVGNLEPKKNIERIIEAFSLLKRERKIEHKLVIVGRKGWMHKEIFKEVDMLQLNQYVIFLGYIPREDLPLLYNVADVFVFPSLYEGFGMPPLEAMACGTPVVTSNVSALPEVVGDAAILVDPQDIREIAEGIYKIIVNEDLKLELAAKGLKRAKLFTWEKAAKKTLEVYKKTAQNS